MLPRHRRRGHGLRAAAQLEYSGRPRLRRAARVVSWRHRRAVRRGAVMDWSNLLRLPTTLLLLLAGPVLLLALVQLLRVRQRLRERRTLAASVHALCCTVCVALSLLLAGGALTLRGYRVLTDEAPVVDVDARILSPQNWALTLTWPDGTTRHAIVLGDAWRVEAVVLKWKLPPLLAGVPPLYRLDRLSGRYDDTQQEATAPRAVVDLVPEGGLDIVDLQ